MCTVLSWKSTVPLCKADTQILAALSVSILYWKVSTAVKKFSLQKDAQDFPRTGICMPIERTRAFRHRIVLCRPHAHW